MGLRIYLQEQRKEERKKRKQNQREEETNSKKKKSEVEFDTLQRSTLVEQPSSPSNTIVQTQQQRAVAPTSRTEPSPSSNSLQSKNTIRKPAQQSTRTQDSQSASQAASLQTARPSLMSTLYAWIDASCLNQGSKVKRPGAGLGAHFPSI